MKKILITGGLGFIGRHLIRYFQAQPYRSELTVIDDLSGSGLKEKDAVQVGKDISVRVEDFLSYRPEGKQFDYIYHLASPVGAIGILNKSGEIAKQIVDLAVKAVEVSLQCKARLMYISSSEIYYASPQQHEETEITLNVHEGARIEYAIGKYAGEVLIRNAAFSESLQFNICRPFNLIGEEQSSKLGFVVPRFFEACLTNLPVEVFGNGQQVRSFCDIQDFVPALVKFQESNLVHETLNIGNLHNRTNILNLAQTIKTLTQSSSQIKFIDPVSKYGNLYMEGGEKLANTEKAKKLIGLELSFNLIDTLKRIHSYYQKLQDS